MVRRQYRQINYVGDIDGATKAIPDFIAKFQDAQEEKIKQLKHLRNGRSVVKNEVAMGLWGGEGSSVIDSNLSNGSGAKSKAGSRVGAASKNQSNMLSPSSPSQEFGKNKFNLTLPVGKYAENGGGHHYNEENDVFSSPHAARLTQSMTDLNVGHESRGSSGRKRSSPQLPPLPR